MSSVLLEREFVVWSCCNEMYLELGTCVPSECPVCGNISKPIMWVEKIEEDGELQ